MATVIDLAEGRFAHLTGFSMGPLFRCRAKLYNERGDGFETTNSTKNTLMLRGFSGIKPRGLASGNRNKALFQNTTQTIFLVCTVICCDEG